MRLPAIAAGAAALASVGLTGCHVQADIVCQARARPQHLVVQAYWSGQADRYDCLSVNQITSSRDRFWVYEVRQADGDIVFIRRD